jgi:hypothetical protein
MENDEKGILKYYNLFKENIAIIVLTIYGVTFINYYIYYKSFEVPIFNYIGLNDMIFFFIEYLFKIILIIFLTEIALFILYIFPFTLYEKIIIFGRKKWRNLYLKSNKLNRERIENLFNNLFSESLNSFRFTVIILSIFIVPFLPYKMAIFPAYFIYLIYYLDKMAKEKMPEFLIPSVSIIVILSMIVSTLITSYDKRFKKEDFTISFYENEKLITTDQERSCYNYLGETSTNIFLFDIERKESVIYSKDNISDIRIKNSLTIDKCVNYVKSSFVYKQFYEMIQH